MRYMHLFENSDYNIARKQYDQLSFKAQLLLTEWVSGGDAVINMSRHFRSKTSTAQEIWNAGKPIRDNIKAREGNSITLYRGLKFYRDKPTPTRYLYSWTSDINVARDFIDVTEEDRQRKCITNSEANKIIEKFKERGYVSFLGHKFLKTQEGIVNVYADGYGHDDNWSKNNLVSDFETIESAIRSYQQSHNRDVDEMKERMNYHKIIKRRIPVKDIVWVLMFQNENGYHENEYIVKGHSG